MMKSEFDAEFNGYVTDDEYNEIEQAYYGFRGDKHDFIKTLNMLSSDASLTEQFLQTCYHNDAHDDMTRKYVMQYYADSFYGTGRLIYGFRYAARLAALQMQDETGLAWIIGEC